jgi:hypothetical protein
MRDGWIIYAIVGVIVCLLLWRVATQWKVRSAEAENLRATAATNVRFRGQSGHRIHVSFCGTSGSKIGKTISKIRNGIQWDCATKWDKINI